jgi:hypothetical protein
MQASTRDGRTLLSWVRSCPDPKVHRTEARYPIRGLLSVVDPEARLRRWRTPLAEDVAHFGTLGKAIGTKPE